MRCIETAFRPEILHGAGSGDIDQMAESIECKPYHYFRSLSDACLNAYFSRYLTAETSDPQNTVLIAGGRDGVCGVAILQDKPWDTKHFGFRCGEVEVFSKGSAYSAQKEVVDRLLKAVLKRAREQGYSFLWTKCHSGFMSLIHSLEENGFRLVDCELTLIHGGDTPAEVDMRYQVSITRNQRVPGLENMGSIFSYSRFHSDPEIPDSKADGLWRKSIVSSCEGFADEVVVLSNETGPVGFVTCKDDKLSKELFPQKVRSFLLVGVAPDHQGMGVGRELMRAALRHSLEETTLIEVEAQSRNQAAIALYHNSGFRVASSRYSFHRWLQPSKRCLV